MLANTPCPINDARTGRLLMGKKAIDKYREDPATFVVGYEEDQELGTGMGGKITKHTTVDQGDPPLSEEELGAWLDDFILANTQEGREEDREGWMPQLGMYVDELDVGGDTPTNEAEHNARILEWTEEELESGFEDIRQAREGDEQKYRKGAS